MPDSGFLLAKVLSGVGGLLGGLTNMAFLKPISMMDASLRGGVSTGTGIIFAAPLLQWFDMQSNWEMQLMFGFCIGFVSWGLLSLISRVFSNAEKNKEDLIDVVNRTRSGQSNNEK